MGTTESILGIADGGLVDEFIKEFSIFCIGIRLDGFDVSSIGVHGGDNGIIGVETVAIEDGFSGAQPVFKILGDLDGSFLPVRESNIVVHTADTFLMEFFIAPDEREEKFSIGVFLSFWSF